MVSPGSTDWTARYREHVALLRSGRLVDVATVAQRLETRADDIGLSGGEQRMLQRARTILTTEVFLGLPDGWEGEQGQAGDREPRRPVPGAGTGSAALELPDAFG